MSDHSADGPAATKGECDPERGVFCQHFTAKHEALEAEKRLRSRYQSISAIKIFSAFIGVVAFLILSVWTSAVIDHHPMPLVAALMDHFHHDFPDYNSTLLTVLFGVGIFVHYWRVFCGISYTEHEDADPGLIGRFRIVFERITKFFFLVTYPVFSALLKTDYAGYALALWAIHATLMIMYDILFFPILRKTGGIEFGLILVNDLVTCMVVGVYWFSQDVERITSNDGPIWILASITLINLVITIIETFTVYLSGLITNFASVVRYVRGSP